MNEALSSRARILPVARSLFAERGYRGTSVRAIITQAQVNLGAVTYHFGGKSGLYEAVLDSLLSPLEERVRAADEEPGPPLDRIERVIGVVVDHLAKNPEQGHIVLHELALQRPLPGRAQRWISFIFATLTRIIRQGQDDGTIVEGTPGMLAASIAAQPFFFAITVPRISEAAGISIAQGPSALAEHLGRVTRRILAAPWREK
jgi:AcrR family transcriptional regulator